MKAVFRLLSATFQNTGADQQVVYCSIQAADSSRYVKLLLLLLLLLHTAAHPSPPPPLSFLI
jgi:hypothetical protein